MKLPAVCMAIAFLAGPAVAVADDLEDAVQSLKDAAAKKDATFGEKAGGIHPSHDVRDPLRDPAQGRR